MTGCYIRLKLVSFPLADQAMLGHVGSRNEASVNKVFLSIAGCTLETSEGKTQLGVSSIHADSVNRA